MADEILAVAELLRARAAAAPGAVRPGPRRRRTGPACSARSSTGKVADGRRRRCCATLVAGRWSSATELLDAAERLGVEALLASARAAGELAEVEDELFRFGQVVDGDPQLAAVLGDLDRAGRAARGSWPTRCSTARRGRPRSGWSTGAGGFGGRNFAASLTRLVELAAERRDRQVAYVTVGRAADRGRGAAASAPASPSCTVGRSTLEGRRWTRRSSAASASRSGTTSTTAPCRRRLDRGAKPALAGNH